MAGGETDAAGSGDGGSCVDGADTAWVLVSFVLVLVMYPGLALFEAGLLRAKNTLSIMMQVFGGVTTLSVLWDVIGYSLVYGPTFHGLIGGVRHALLFEVAYDTCSPFAPTIPTAAFAMFQVRSRVV
jgi:Amt family ammonium transporter